MLVYVDTSAAAKLLVEESESVRLAERLDALDAQDHALMSSLLLETELRRLAVRERLEQSTVSDVVSRFDLYELRDRSSTKRVSYRGRTCGLSMPCTWPPPYALAPRSC